MSSMIIGLLAETSLHPGSESSGGVVDLPVAREATTAYPVLMGSGLKGALRDVFQHKYSQETTDRIFGAPNGAGGISVTDGRLLLLPVRSLSSNYRWVTCPYILERLQRDLQLAGLKEEFTVPHLEKEKAVAAVEDSVYLEELSFAVAKDEEILNTLVNTIKPLILHKSVQDRVVNQLIVISDDDFKHFASFGLPVNARNVLDKDNKTSKNLWYEEIIPADSLFYTMLLPRYGRNEDLQEILDIFEDRPYLQIGGNETIGQGWCAISCWEGR